MGRKTQRTKSEKKENYIADNTHTHQKKKKKKIQCFLES